MSPTPFEQKSFENCVGPNTVATMMAALNFCLSLVITVPLRYVYDKINEHFKGVTRTVILIII